MGRGRGIRSAGHRRGVGRSRRRVRIECAGERPRQRLADGDLDCRTRRESVGDRAVGSADVRLHRGVADPGRYLVGDHDVPRPGGSVVGDAYLPLDLLARHDGVGEQHLRHRQIGL